MRPIAPTPTGIRRSSRSRLPRLFPGPPTGDSALATRCRQRVWSGHRGRMGQEAQTSPLSSSQRRARHRMRPLGEPLDDLEEQMLDRTLRRNLQEEIPQRIELRLIIRRQWHRSSAGSLATRSRSGTSGHGLRLSWHKSSYMQNYRVNRATLTICCQLLHRTCARRRAGNVPAWLAGRARRVRRAGRTARPFSPAPPMRYIPAVPRPLTNENSQIRLREIPSCELSQAGRDGIASLHPVTAQCLAFLFRGQNRLACLLRKGLLTAFHRRQ